ncbi:hypothetical protein CW734_13525 [Planococcus sp. MB-3u-03]|nr:hypothetical protein CW734_13525 [Planococcus sp. MB-3u-03]
MIEEEYLLFYGYDNDIKSYLGIDSINTSEHSVYGGVRLVQTHNNILNIFIKTGIAFALIYLLILSKIIDKYYIKENIEYIFPYLINSIIMHSMLNTGFWFWILVLHLPKVNKSLIKLKGIKIYS